MAEWDSCPASLVFRHILPLFFCVVVKKNMFFQCVSLDLKMIRTEYCSASNHQWILSGFGGKFPLPLNIIKLSGLRLRCPCPSCVLVYKPH